MEDKEASYSSRLKSDWNDAPSNFGRRVPTGSSASGDLVEVDLRFSSILCSESYIERSLHLQSVLSPKPSPHTASRGESKGLFHLSRRGLLPLIL